LEEGIILWCINHVIVIILKNWVNIFYFIQNCLVFYDLFGFFLETSLSKVKPRPFAAPVISPIQKTRIRPRPIKPVVAKEEEDTNDDNDPIDILSSSSEYENDGGNDDSDSDSDYGAYL
jgi:hypothetical protein